MDIPTKLLVVIVVITLWALPWKGFALWRAAKNNEPYWFIALFVFNTAALLEIYYLFFRKHGPAHHHSKFEAKIK